MTSNKPGRPQAQHKPYHVDGPPAFPQRPAGWTNNGFRWGLVIAAREACRPPARIMRILLSLMLRAQQTARAIHSMLTEKEVAWQPDPKYPCLLPKTKIATAYFVSVAGAMRARQPTPERARPHEVGGFSCRTDRSESNHSRCRPRRGWRTVEPTTGD